MCQKCHFAFPKPYPLPISLAINNQMNTPYDVLLNIQRGISVPSTMVIIFTFINFYYMEFSLGLVQNPPLGVHCPRCSITHIPQQPAERRHTAHGAL